MYLLYWTNVHTFTQRSSGPNPRYYLSLTYSHYMSLHIYLVRRLNTEVKDLAAAKAIVKPVPAWRTRISSFLAGVAITSVFGTLMPRLWHCSLLLVLLIALSYLNTCI